MLFISAIKMSSSPLLVFDFDHTITDLNTDVEVQKLAPGGEIPASSEMRGLYTDKGWTDFMGAVFALLHENNVTQVRYIQYHRVLDSPDVSKFQSEILSLMAGLGFTSNMSNLLEESVKDLGATIIIISDSNSVFINHILEVQKMDHLVDKVFTNPAHWTEDGKLLIQPYHHQVEGGRGFISILSILIVGNLHFVNQEPVQGSDSRGLHFLMWEKL